MERVYNILQHIQAHYDPNIFGSACCWHLHVDWADKLTKLSLCLRVCAFEHLVIDPTARRYYLIMTLHFYSINKLVCTIV